MLIGFFYGVIACAFWGLVYVIPIMLKAYDPLFIALARYTVFGAISTAILLRHCDWVHKLSLPDIRIALALGIVGNLFFYWLLAKACVLAGAPVAGAFTALIPISVAIVANREALKEGKGVAWRNLAGPLLLISLGMGCLNWTEFVELNVSGVLGASKDFCVGLIFAFLSLLVWTWYPISNAKWLLEHRSSPPSIWAAAQGASQFPVALLGLIAYVAVQPEAASVLEPTPTFFLISVIVLGFFCSYVAIIFWNMMSQRMPPALSGQMIIFETIFAVIYAHFLRNAWPTPLMCAGLFMLLVGVVWAFRVFRQTRAQEIAREGGITQIKCSQRQI